MSRPLLGLDNVSHRFPRVSGDEPDLCELNYTRGSFSPRERG